MRPLLRAVFALLAAGAPCGVSAAGPDGLDQVVLNGVLSAASVTAPGRQEVWRGYDLLAQPVLLYRDPGFSMLVGHPSPPPDFRPFPSAIFPRFSVYASTEPRLDVSSVFYTAYPLGGKRVFVTRYGEKEDVLETIATVVHERFHVYQDGTDGSAPAFKNLYSGRELYASDMEPENLALAGMEETLLARALLDGRKDQEAIKDLISVRMLRRGLFGMKWAALDNDLERLEGTAEYVTGRVKELISEDGGVFSAETLARTLLREPEQDETVEHLLHGRQYNTGAAICLLLDRHVPGWKRRVAGEEYPFEILLKAFPVPTAELRARAAAAKKELGYGIRLKYAGYALDSARLRMKEANEAFLAHAGPRLVLRAPYTGDTKVSYRSKTVHKLNDRTELFVDNPLYEFANGGVRLLVRDATLQVFSGKDGSEMIQVLLSSAPSVLAGGKPAAPSAVPADAAEVLVEAPGVTLSAKRALLQAADGTVYVDIR